MYQIKKRNFIKTTIVTLINTFIFLNISYAYSSEYNTSNSILSHHSALQQNPIDPIQSATLQNSGYRILETIPLIQKDDVLAKIIQTVIDLDNLSIYPQVDKQKLIDILRAESSGLVTVIKNSTILSDENDIFNLLDIKKKSIISGGLTVEEMEKLSLYEIIFENHLHIDMPITIFSGGTGSNRLMQGLLEKGSYKTTLLLNAYDDGKSTGDIRRNFNILGPSDIAKNIIVLLSDKNVPLAKLLNHRISKEGSISQFRDEVSSLANGVKLGEIGKLWHNLNNDSKAKLKIYFSSLMQSVEQWEKNNGRIYDFRNYGIRNLVFLGAYIYYQQNYRKAINELINDFDLQGHMVLNSYEPLWLIAITENGKLLNSEAEIVEAELNQEIAEIFLVKKLLAKEEVNNFNNKCNVVEKIRFIKDTFAFYPQATLESLDAIKKAKSIIFAPTTFHSSLSPTLITKGISDALASSSALKILISNLIRERGKHTVGEALESIQHYINYGRSDKGKTELDYIIVNSHGYQTQGTQGTPWLPIDLDKIHQLGVEVISINVDKNHTGKHDPDLITQTVMILQSIDRVGYCISNGKLLKKNAVNKKNLKRLQLKKLIANPLLYKQNAYKVEQLILDILGIDDLEKFIPPKTRVVILAAGRATRLKSNIPKVIYPINGKANLSFLMEALSAIDKNPILAVNQNDFPKVKEWLYKNSSYQPKLIIIPSGKGTAIALQDLQGTLRQDKAKDILFMWGDISNIKPKTLWLTLAAHEALGTSSMTLPTSWEKNPYAGVINNEEGQIIDVFLTKEHPEEKTFAGAHDGSVFLFNVNEIIPFIHKLVQDSGFNEGKISEVNFLKVIPLLGKNRREIYGLPCMDPREAKGFNTTEEAEQVGRYKKELSNEVLLGQEILHTSIASVSLCQKPVIVDKKIKREHNERFKNYLKYTYGAIALDVDDTITENSKIPDRVIDTLVGYANKGIPIAFITGRTNNSLEKLLLIKIKSHEKLNGGALKNFYVYLENGMYGYRLDHGLNKKLYEIKLPSSYSEATSFYLRKHILESQDNYSITEHKIHIWPNDASRQAEYLAKIRKLFQIVGLPLVVFKSNSVETTGSLLISLENQHKGVAFKNFLKEIDLSIDQVAKIADLADRDSVDWDLLRGNGSFTVNEFDITSDNQVAMKLVSSEPSNVSRTLLLLNFLMLEPQKKASQPYEDE